MVAAISSSPRIPETPSTPNRAPLSSSDNNNNDNNNNSNNANTSTVPRKPKTKDITSRYLPSPSSSPSPHLRSNPKMDSPRIVTTTTTRSLSVSFQGESFSFQTTKQKPVVSQNPPPTPKKPKPRNPRLGSLTLRVLGHSVDFGDNGEIDCKGNRVTTSRGISVPARFWPGSFSPAKRTSLMDAQLLSPRKGRGCLPNKVADLSVKRMTSSPVKGQQENVVSILSFAAEARRVKKGERRIEDAHSLRLLYNQNLQWRYVNAQADAAISTQRVNAERNLYHAWITTSDLHNSVINKRIKLQLLLQNLKLTSIIKGQMSYLEEWAHVEREHCTNLSVLTEALKASTLRLPVVSGAKVDVLELHTAIDSAVDMMQAMRTSISSLLSKVEGASVLVSELAKAAAHERALLEQSKDLLSTVAVLKVKQCSLHGQIMQQNHRRGIGQMFILKKHRILIN